MPPGADEIAALLRRADALLSGDAPDVVGARSAIAAARDLSARPAEVAAGEDLIGTIAHELRNPVSPMVFQVEYMMMQVERGDPHVPATWVLEQLEGLRRRLGAFVASLDRLLDVSQIRTGALVIEREWVDAVALVREVAAAAADEARAGGSSIRVVAGEDEVVGCWDRLRLEQALRNLVSNAIRYGAGADIELAVEAEPEWVRLEVRDRGPGIDPAKLDHIFDRFGRASNKSGGFGIGLWLVKQIALALGGDVEGENRAGAGARFTITLPRDPRVAEHQTS